VVGTVRFGNGSNVQIDGCGIIFFACKNGEHHTLGNVYYISCLTANIISCGQLDKVGYEIGVQGGMMCIRDDHMRLLYLLDVLDIDIACPVYLNVVTGEDAWC
jgi:hypothetical protein